MKNNKSKMAQILKTVRKLKVKITSPENEEEFIQRAKEEGRKEIVTELTKAEKTC